MCHSRPLFFISYFQCSWQYMFNIIFCRWLDSNSGPLDRQRLLYQLSHNHCPCLIDCLIVLQDLTRTSGVVEILCNEIFVYICIFFAKIWKWGWRERSSWARARGRTRRRSASTWPSASCTWSDCSPSSKRQVPAPAYLHWIIPDAFFTNMLILEFKAIPSADVVGNLQCDQIWQNFKSIGQHSG